MTLTSPPSKEVAPSAVELLQLADQQAYMRARYNEEDSGLIRESRVIEWALRQAAIPAAGIREALENILQANDSFRASLPDGWEGDPLNDACIEARAALQSVQPGEGVDTITVPYNPCLAKLRPGEPFFVLLGRDKQAPNAVMTWANDRQAAEGKSAWTEQAREVAYAMASYSGLSPALPLVSGDGRK